VADADVGDDADVVEGDGGQRGSAISVEAEMQLTAGGVDLATSLATHAAIHQLQVPSHSELSFSLGDDDGGLWDAARVGLYHSGCGMTQRSACKSASIASACR
jgi:hypothetical protein